SVTALTSYPPPVVTAGAAGAGGISVAGWSGAPRLQLTIIASIIPAPYTRQRAFTVASDLWVKSDAIITSRWSRTKWEHCAALNNWEGGIHLLFVQTKGLRLKNLWTNRRSLSVQAHSSPWLHFCQPSDGRHNYFAA